VALPASHTALAALAVEGDSSSGRHGYVCTSTLIAVQHVSTLRVDDQGNVTEAHDTRGLYEDSVVRHPRHAAHLRADESDSESDGCDALDDEEDVEMEGVWAAPGMDYVMLENVALLGSYTMYDQYY
jgi:hypothetical protein